MKTISLIIIYLLLCNLTSTAQDKKSTESAVFIQVEEMPEFPGGQQALFQYISQSVRYPSEAHKKGIQGKVYVQFEVDTDGKVTGAKIARGVDSLLDAEALRVVSVMPAWKPGKQEGKPVKVSYTLPITFALQDDSTKEETLTVRFVQNRMQISGTAELIERMRPFLQGDKPATYFSKETGTIMFNKSDLPLDEPVFYVVEEMPEFPGGEAALRKSLAENIQYPAEAKTDSIQGKVYVSFVIDKEGKVKDTKVVRGVHPLLDKEATRAVGALPAWKPGRHREQPVNVQYTVPVAFVLQ